MTNEELYERAMQAITDLYNDTSVSQQECEENLNSLIGEIETMLDALDVSE